jgi:hypothetical protein
MRAPAALHFHLERADIPWIDPGRMRGGSMKANRGLNPRALTLIAAAALTLAASPRTSAAGANDFILEAPPQRVRGGAGLRAATWQVVDLADASGITQYEGWLQKGLDLHLVLESTLGYWQHEESSTTPGPLSTETTHELYTYLVPALTAMKMYPVTKPTAALEPYLAAGLGPVLRIQREKITSTDPLEIPSDETRIETGFGIQSSAGLDWSPPGAFGLSLGGSYQWATFGQNASGRRMYRGPGVNVGLTYRFQY